MKPDDQKLAKCVRNVENWGDITNAHKFDKSDYDPEAVLKDLSPKLESLMNKIKELDQADMQKDNKLYKHFVYSDITTQYGAKLIAAVLAAHGFEHAYEIGKGKRGNTFVFKKTDPSNTFGTLTSTKFFDREIGVKFRKELLAKYNARPNSEIRIIVLDSGFREGIDLFDVKYVHIIEPILTPNDFKQAVGRATRFCGQKGLVFNNTEGWVLHVFKYTTSIPLTIRRFFDSNLINFSDSVFSLFLRFSNIDPRKLVFSKELDKMLILSSIDLMLNKSIHGSLLQDLNTDGFVDKFLDMRYSGKVPKSPSNYISIKNVDESKYTRYKRWDSIKVENGCGDNRQQNANNIIEYSPTQEFMRKYFSAKSNIKGMLSYSSVGTGKTCQAIAIGSSSYEQENYTIIYVTRHTLKGDVWKNMFDQICSYSIALKLRSGELSGIPSTAAAKARLIKNWFTPLSYKQFSNMLKGKNELYSDLVKRNGKTDPLRKTLVIVDEAHKLFAPDVSGSEKPDIDIIVDSIHKSYGMSGNDSVRVLLMTATPFTSDPMDALKLVNILKPKEEQFPTNFEEFKEIYLDDQGHFTSDGLSNFYKNVGGIISYLNREKDIRTFAQPKYHDIEVMLSDYSFINNLKDYQDLQEIANKARKAYRDKQIEKDFELLLFTKHLEVLKHTEYKIQEKRLNYLDCLKGKEKSNTSFEEEYKKAIEACNENEKVCKDSVRKDYAALTKQTRSEHKKDPRLKEILQKLKDDKKFDLDECKDLKNKCKEEAKVENKAQQAKQAKQDKQKCESMQKELKQTEELAEKEIKEGVIAQKKVNDTFLEVYKEIASESEHFAKQFKDILEESIKTDKSQRTALEKCLAVKKPAYKRMLNNDIPPVYNSFDESPDKDSDNKVGTAGTHVIIGHGYENVIPFAKRAVMPDNKILIVFPLCAKPLYMDIGCRILSILNNPAHAEIVKNPLENLEELENLFKVPVHVYRPGDKLPELNTNLFLNFNSQSKSAIVKSGVYNVPGIPSINRGIFPEIKDNIFGGGLLKCYDYLGQIEDIYNYDSMTNKEIFRGNLFKPAYNKQMSFTQLERRTFNVPSIMNTVGDGIYYYISCRSGDIKNMNNYVKILDQSANQQKNKGKHAPTPELPMKDRLQILKDVAGTITGNTFPALETCEKIKDILVKLDTSDFTETNKTKVQKLITHTENIIKVHKNNLTPTKVLSKTTKKDYIYLNIYDEYTISGKVKFKVLSKYIGCIAKDFKIKDQKCSVNTIVNRIKSELNTTQIELPKTPEDWDTQTKDDIINNLC